MHKNPVKHIEVQILNSSYARVVVIRKKGSAKYLVCKDSLASRKLPSILDKAKHVDYSPPKRKGDGIKWTDTHYRENIPAKHTYTF